MCWSFLFEICELSQVLPRLDEVHERLDHLLLGDVVIAEALAEVFVLGVLVSINFDLKEIECLI